jgi:DNA topoisomerase VI subunit B
MNQGQDKIGVFVSIVSTKIPFKGTGKEYIGDDITEISSAVQVTDIPLLTFCASVY